MWSFLIFLLFICMEAGFMEGNILLIDDEKEITDLLEVYLKNEGFCVYKFYRADPVISCIREHWFFPIIMLTARISDGDKIEGLKMGADDYITKPTEYNQIRRGVYRSLMLRFWRIFTGLQG